MGFAQGNKYGGFRENAGRKKKSVKDMELERQQTAREIYRAEQQRMARQVIATYYRLATSGRYPQATLHEIDKIDPDEQVTAPTISITFVAFNPGSIPSSGNDARIIDVSSSSSPASPVIDSPHVAKDGPCFTFLDITEKD